ncbi:acetate--CoA ligase family protein [Pollutimonas bauzanensis]|uniref:Acyl-CoA synthetase (NDP forming) n=1 Tax=Pollutimonas bauzanensis TaxID=658167 RepID=A0A1M5USH2_9BURK|nr:acetate--CoA ligase family protein [Pollutimonas bauzanensis]SHH65874.1 Acyl-CoA synthetase (NDP forming) [Pollutimonas bauzanensis]
MLMASRHSRNGDSDSSFPDLARFFAPRAVAMIGATEDLGKFGGRCMRQMMDFGYKGAIYPVNPRRDEIFGLRCFASVAALPAAPDHVGIVLPAHLVPAALEQCAERGVPFVTVFSSGFGEVGSAQGAADQQRLVDIARAGNIRLMGPNCNGMINFVDGFALTSTATIQGPRRAAGDIGVVSQSGGAGQVNIMWRAQQSGLGISYQVSCGNAADLDLVDYASFMLESEKTKVVLMLAESLADGGRLRMLARRAADLDKPIVMVKVGRSAAGSKAAASHTGAITGADDVCDAALRQMGIVRVSDCNELYETAMLLRQARRPRGHRAAAMSISGGNLVMVADLGASEGIEWPAYTGETTQKLAELLPGFGAATNPTDLTAAAIGQKNAYKDAAETILADPNVDILIPVLTINSANDVRAVAEVSARSDKPMAILWTGCASDDAALTREVLVAEGHAVYRDALPCLKAVQRTMQYAEFRRRLADAPAARPAGIDVEAARLLLEQADGPLSEHRSKALLQHYGLPVTMERLTSSAEAAWQAASHIDGPVALKIQSPDILHKTEAGAIRLGVSGELAVKGAYEEVISAARAYRPDARIEGVLVQEMIADAHEMLVGVSHDATFGPVLALGLGGIYVEVLKDVVFRLAPLTADEAQRALAELRTYKLLEGVRGKAPADMDALIDAIVRISWLTADLGDRIAELDINPLCVLPKGRGARVVDALIVPRRAAG